MSASPITALEIACAKICCPRSDTKFLEIPCAKICCPRNDTKFHEDMRQFEGHEISASPMPRTTNTFCRSALIHRVVAMRRSHL